MAKRSLNPDGTYTVRPGDTLSAIAQDLLGDASRYREIFALNGPAGTKVLRDPNLIHPGQVLQMPGSGATRGTQSMTDARVQWLLVTGAPKGAVFFDPFVLSIIGRPLPVLVGGTYARDNQTLIQKVFGYHVSLDMPIGTALIGQAIYAVANLAGLSEQPSEGERQRVRQICRRLLTHAYYELATLTATTRAHAIIRGWLAKQAPPSGRVFVPRVGSGTRPAGA